jgi:hypothetical protein
MSDAQRAVLDRHCDTAWAEKIAAPWAQWERAGREALASRKGHELQAVTPEQVGAWRTAAEPLTASWAERVKRVNGDPDAALKALKAELAKHGAAF